MKRLFGIFTTLSMLYFGATASAQQCSRESLSAKYWQYRETFNDHFIMIDRREEGCVGNGIFREDGIHPANNTVQQHCGLSFLNGYSLPATSINQLPNGGHQGLGMIDRNTTGSAFYDGACADGGPSIGTSWEDNATHNYLEMGEETPHQMQWYWTMLATEYALLRQNGQWEEAGRTLEELYLGLQAYRRLDMLANCMAQERYEEVTNDFEVEYCDDNHCLCGDKYLDVPGAFNTNFKTDTQDNCPFTADLSGYTGFALREDATQELEALHDDSEDHWNIDLVSGDYAMSSMPPCTTATSQACYNVKGKNFLSSDQMYALMQGLVMIKKYIPADAVITNCDGTVENILDIAQNIGKGLVDVAKNETRRINWPASRDCCDAEVHMSEAAGGYLNFNYAGLEIMYNYLSDDDDRKIGLLDGYLFNQMGATLLPLQHREGKFYLEAMAFGVDIAQWPNTFNTPIPLSPLSSFARRQLIIEGMSNQRVEIYLLINNLLFPAPPNLSVDKSWFEALLCTAPCGGPCQKPADYDQTSADGLNIPPPAGPVVWPQFDCPNTPHWTGQRWEGLGGDLDWDNIHEARQFNGLDFMALYNIYLLSFPEEHTEEYYNPDRPQEIPYGHLFGHDRINGPTTLCPGTMGSYSIVPLNAGSGIENISWTTTNNLQAMTPNANPTDIRAISAQTPSWIMAEFDEVRTVAQYHNGEETTGTVEDVCPVSYKKIILTETPDYDIGTYIIPCNGDFQAYAVDAEYHPDVTYTWGAANPAAGMSITGQDNLIDFVSIVPAEEGVQVQIILTLIASTDCGQRTITQTVNFETCDNGGMYERQILISPNPAQNQVTVSIVENQSQPFVSNDPNGVRLRVYPSNGGAATLMDSYLTANGQQFNVGTLPNGLYQMIATANDLTPVSANFAIVR